MHEHIVTYSLDGVIIPSVASVLDRLVNLDTLVRGIHVEMIRVQLNSTRLNPRMMWVWCGFFIDRFNLNK